MGRVGHCALRASRAVACLLGCAALAACADDVPQKKAPPPATVESDDTATAEAAKAPPYIYTPLGKRDPFRDPSTLRLPPPSAKAGPLQQYDLGQLKLVFTTTATSSPMALVADPTGQTHFVQIGDFVGRNWGKVTSIQRESITVTETTVEPNSGRVFPKPVELRMAETDADQNAQKAYTLQWSREGDTP